MVTVGSGEYVYEPVVDWAKLPSGWSFKEIGSVGVDKNDNVYVFNRGEHPNAARTAAFSDLAASFVRLRFLVAGNDRVRFPIVVPLLHRESSKAFETGDDHFCADVRNLAEQEVVRDVKSM